MTKYEKSVSCRKENLFQLRTFVAEVLSDKPISEQEKKLVVLAVDEVCTNVMVHAHQCNPEKKVKLVIKPDDKKLTFEIHNDGAFFNILEHECPTVSEVIQQKKSGGLGLILVKHIMDAIEIDFKEKVYRLTKSIVF